MMKEIKDSLLLNEYVSCEPYTQYFSDHICSYVKIVEFEAGEYVFLQDETPKCLYLMLQGRCSVRMQNTNKV